MKVIKTVVNVPFVRTSPTKKELNIGRIEERFVKIIATGEYRNGLPVAKIVRLSVSEQNERERQLTEKDK